MKIVVFGDPPYRVGAVVDDKVIDLNRADSSIPPRLLDLIELGGPGLDRVRSVVEKIDTLPPDSILDLAEVTLRAPWPERRLLMAGGNYGRHLMGVFKNFFNRDETLEDTERNARESGQWGFWKSIITAAGPEDEVRIPKRTNRFDYEAELAIILSGCVRDFSGERCDDLVWGVTLVNDWSIRDDKRHQLDQFALAKNFDGCISIGPYIAVDEAPYDDVAVELRVNGGLRQQFSTSEMIHSFAEILAFVSRDLTLVPGDLIAGGTGAGTAADASKKLADGTVSDELFLKAGDVTEVSSPGLGTLRNRLI
jgi:2-keto-4-pentenoate hydratase/2-oxohepta-3-ene-1,7-dioic acid hydratase in catechol pathway